MGSKPNTSSYITHLNELYSNYERVKAQLENERQTRLDEPNKVILCKILSNLFKFYFFLRTKKRN